MCNISQELEQLEAYPYTSKLSIESPQIFVLNEAFTSEIFNFQTACGKNRCVFSAVSSEFFQFRIAEWKARYTGDIITYNNTRDTSH